MTRSSTAASAATTLGSKMERHEFMQRLHQLVKPRTYVETGVDRGQSMTLSRTQSIGIDPAFAVNRELLADIQLARTTSDEFFARPRPLEHFRRPFIDLAFIDGMHLAEYALRDYLAVERFTTRGSVVVFDDMLPRNIDEAARHRHTGAWTGDVYKATGALRSFPEPPIVFEINTQPTGIVVVLAPDAARDGAWDGYDAWLETAISPDPQDVPASVLERTDALDPEQVLSSSGWAALRLLRSRRRVSRAEIARAFADILPAGA